MSSFISEEEDLIYSQIKSYKESQNFLKELINNNIKTDFFELYAINDNWLNKWKEYSCYDQIKNNLFSPKSKKFWIKLRNKYKVERFGIEEINSDSLNTKFALNSDSNFHFVTKECFSFLSKNN